MMLHMLAGYDEQEFRVVLPKYFTPAQPVSKPDHLHGRHAKLKAIDRALSSPGKHVFIYGDRGIGKTSLARTALQIHNKGSDFIPLVACEHQSDFYELVDSMRRQLTIQRNENTLPNASLLDAPPTTNSGLALPTMRSINDAVEALRAVAPPKGAPAVVIVDEFDQLHEDKDKKAFADLIKQLSDQEINLRLILCGIGRSLEELIGVHLSTDRYLATVPLDQIPHDARWAILEAACNHFKVSLDRDSMIRIGQISDGFPYYVHLIGEKIFWEIMDDPSEVSEMSLDHYQRGIKSAIEESQTSLRQAYELATQKHGNSEDYEEVLWSVADGALLQRQMTTIYEQSYLNVMGQRPGRTPLTKEPFYQRMNKLKKENHGCVIIGTRQGWYGFKENVVRGYVRLRAERAGVRIGVDHLRAGA
jgi:hypothetical protein